MVINSEEAANTVSSKSTLSSQRHTKAKFGNPLRVMLLLLFLGAGIWGISNNPRLLEYRYSKMSLRELEEKRGTRTDDPALLYYQGLRLNEAGRYIEADPLLRQAVALDPDHVEYRDEWTRALLGSGLTTTAFGQLKQYAGTHPNLPESHLLLGKFYVTQHSMQRATEELQKTVELAPQQGEAWRYLALAHLQTGNFSQAQQAVVQAEKLRSHDAEVYYLKATLQAYANENNAARTSYETALRLDPANPIVKRDYAIFLLKTRANADEDKRAEQLTREVVSQNPKDGLAQLTLGRSLVGQKRFQESIAPLTAAAENLAALPASAKELADVYHQLGKTIEENQWRQIQTQRQSDFNTEADLLWKLSSRPNDRNLHLQLAKLLAKRGDVEGTVRNFAAASGNPLDAPPTLIAASNALCEGNHAEEALPLAQRAFDTTKSNPDAIEALGNALLGVGRMKEAAEQYDSAAHWIPARYEIYKAKLLAYRRSHTPTPSLAEAAYLRASRELMGQFGPHRSTETVEAAAREAVAREPQNPKYLRFLIDVVMLKRDHREALPLARQLLMLQPNNPAARAQLALQLVNNEGSVGAISEAAQLLSETPVPGTDAGTLALWYYTVGMVALKQNKGQEAVSRFKQSLRYDDADGTYYQLAQAERMSGNKQAALQALHLFNERKEKLLDEAFVLGQLHEQPNNPDLYTRAIQVFRSHGKQEQALAIQAEANRRFGKKRNAEFETKTAR